MSQDQIAVAEYEAWLDEAAAENERQEAEREQQQREAVFAALAINGEVFA